MIKIAVMLGVGILLLLLVRKDVIQIDLSFPWFAAIVMLGFASTSPAFVAWLAGMLGIVFAPLAVVFLVIFLMLGIIVVLTIGLTRVRRRQIRIIRHLAALELAAAERRLTARP